MLESYVLDSARRPATTWIQPRPQVPGACSTIHFEDIAGKGSEAAHLQPDYRRAGGALRRRGRGYHPEVTPRALWPRLEAGRLGCASVFEDGRVARWCRVLSRGWSATGCGFDCPGSCWYQQSEQLGGRLQRDWRRQTYESAGGPGIQPRVRPSRLGDHPVREARTARDFKKTPKGAAIHLGGGAGGAGPGLPSCRSCMLEYRSHEQAEIDLHRQALPDMRQPRGRAGCTPVLPPGGRGHRAGCPPPTPTCRTSPSAPRRAGASVRPSSRR